MAGGFLRFQAQYLRRLRLPRWERVSEVNRAALRAADGFDDMDVVDAPVFALFGLSEEEGVLVRRIADEAQVTGRRRREAAGVCGCFLTTLTDRKSVVSGESVLVRFEY